jgi:hypothetical protein
MAECQDFLHAWFEEGFETTDYAEMETPGHRVHKKESFISINGLKSLKES